MKGTKEQSDNLKRLNRKDGKRNIILVTLDKMYKDTDYTCVAFKD